MSRVHFVSKLRAALASLELHSCSMSAMALSWARPPLTPSQLVSYNASLAAAMMRRCCTGGGFHGGARNLSVSGSCGKSVLDKVLRRERKVLAIRSVRRCGVWERVSVGVGRTKADAVLDRRRAVHCQAAIDTTATQVRQFFLLLRTLSKAIRLESMSLLFRIDR